MTALLEESRREGWGPPQVQVDEDRLPKMMMMTHRDDPSSSMKVDDDGLTEDDWDVVCQFFWLPHSHGPMVERLLEDFRLCLVNMNSSPCPDPQWNLTKYQFHQPGGVATPLLQFEDGGGDLIYNLPLQDNGFF